MRMVVKWSCCVGDDDDDYDDCDVADYGDDDVEDEENLRKQCFQQSMRTR